MSRHFCENRSLDESAASVAVVAHTIHHGTIGVSSSQGARSSHTWRSGRAAQRHNGPIVSPSSYFDSFDCFNKLKIYYVPR